jgi:hypothetical protein
VRTTHGKEKEKYSLPSFFCPSFLPSFHRREERYRRGGRGRIRGGKGEAVEEGLDAFDAGAVLRGREADFPEVHPAEPLVQDVIDRLNEFREGGGERGTHITPDCINDTRQL